MAMSATLSPCVRRDILKKLQFDKKNYININIGIIPNGVKCVNDIPKTLVYADQISAKVGIEMRLMEHLPPKLCDIGLIRPFSAAFSPGHQQELLSLFKAGVV